MDITRPRVKSYHVSSDWLTKAEVAKLIGKSEKTVDRRLTELSQDDRTEHIRQEGGRGSRISLSVELLRSGKLGHASTDLVLELQEQLSLTETAHQVVSDEVGRLQTNAAKHDLERTLATQQADNASLRAQIDLLQSQLQQVERERNQMHAALTAMMENLAPPSN